MKPCVFYVKKRTGCSKLLVLLICIDKEVDKVESIFAFLLPEWREKIEKLPPLVLEQIEELRFRVGQPLLLRLLEEDVYLQEDGGLSQNPAEGFVVSPEMIKRMVLLLSRSSFYALEEELRQGYITLAGGHRAGLAGQAVLEGGHLRTLKNISSINLRLAKAVFGAANHIIPWVIEGKEVLSTLLVSPPRCGKTTVLRDLIRQFSDGLAGLNPLDVGLVDERSEIAGALDGQPQLAVGHRTDVLDGCPKAEGMVMMVRAMSCQVLATDEIGRKEDVAAILEAINAGQSVLATAHGANWQQLAERPIFQEMLSMGSFKRVVFLSRRQGPGTLEKVCDGKGKELFTLC